MGFMSFKFLLIHFHQESILNLFIILQNSHIYILIFIIMKKLCLYKFGQFKFINNWQNGQLIKSILSKKDHQFISVCLFTTQLYTIKFEVKLLVCSNYFLFGVTNGNTAENTMIFVLPSFCTLLQQISVSLRFF